MNDLKDARQKQKEEEIKQVSLMSKYFEQQRERFDYADTAQWLLDDKCDTDLIYIQEKVSEWSKVAKTDTQKKVLNEMFLGVLRVSSYIDTMRTLAKHSVSKYVTAEKEVQRLNSEKRLMKLDKDKEISRLKKELENAKKEIEFIERNNS
ncbi:MAG: hypothetical protein U0T80_13160 [Flavobacteriaceae bacterium]